MKKRTLKIGLAVFAAAVLCGTAVWFFLRPSEEFQLRRRYAELEALLSCYASAGPVSKAGKARQARHFLLEPCRFAAPPYCEAVLTRDEASKLLLRAYSSVEMLKIRFRDFEAMTVQNGRADVRCTLQVCSSGPSGRTDEVRILQCILQKVRGEWFFAEVHAEEVIRR